MSISRWEGHVYAFPQVGGGTFMLIPGQVQGGHEYPQDVKEFL